jgi:hypothetical protein
VIDSATLGTFEKSGSHFGTVVFPVKLMIFFVDVLVSHFPVGYKSRLMAWS